MQLIPVMTKAKFLAAIGPTSEIILICWFGAEETFLINIVVLLNIFTKLWYIFSEFLESSK